MELTAVFGSCGLFHVFVSKQFITDASESEIESDEEVPDDDDST